TRPFHGMVGAEATRERLLATPGLETASVIHVATHGQADEFESARAGLWLAASAEQGPGFLSVADVLRLKLAADLVTLSACETGIGRVARGEGVLGLPRAFLAAGARGVLVSLWKVNDRSTSDLMEAFYRGLLKDRKDGARALAEAKRRMIERPETR